MPRKPKQQRAIATTDAIIRAGFLCVAEHGTEGTTTRHIAAKAGVGVGSLYEYYENKEAIYEAMADHFVAEVVDMVKELVPQITGLSIDDAIRLLLSETRELLSRDDDLYLNFLQKAPNLDIRQYVERVNTTLMEVVIQYLMRHPQYTRLEKMAASNYIFIHGGIFALVTFLTDPNPPISFDEFSEALANIISGEARRAWRK